LEKHPKSFPIPSKLNIQNYHRKKLQGCETNSSTLILAWTLKQFGKQSNIISQDPNRQFKKSKKIKDNTIGKQKQKIEKFALLLLVKSVICLAWLLCLEIVISFFFLKHDES
jgi:hypothetical protein